MLHELFEVARNNKPTVLFIDEIDAVGMSREKHPESFGHWSINFLQNWMAWI